MANTALKKITTRAKAIRRAHPGKAWKTAVKEAGREYRSGKIKTKKRPVKRVIHKRAKRARRRALGAIRPNTGALTVREIVTASRARVGSHRRKPKRRRARATRRASPPRRRRIGQRSSNSALMPVLLTVGAGLLAYVIFKRQSPPPAGTNQQGLVSTGNAYRDSRAAEILAWATAGGLAIDAISKLIAALNSSDQRTIDDVKNTIDQDGTLPYGFIAGY